MPDSNKVPFATGTPYANEVRTHLLSIINQRFKKRHRKCERCGTDAGAKRGVPYHRHLRNYGGKEKPEDIVLLCRPCMNEIVARRKEARLTLEDLPFVDPRFEDDLRAGRQPEKPKRGRPRKKPIEPDKPKRKYTKREPENKDWSQEILALRVAITKAGRSKRIEISVALAMTKRLNDELKQPDCKIGETLKRYKRELASL